MSAAPRWTAVAEEVSICPSCPCDASTAMEVSASHDGGMTERRSSPALVLIAMCAGYFLVLLDVTIVNVALPRLGADLGADVASLQWVVDGYAVAFASLLLASGAAGDRLGHRRIVLIGLGVFGAASVACTVAPTSTVLVVA